MKKIVRPGLCITIVFLVITVLIAEVQAGGYVPNPSISADGRYVAFDSDVANLVPGDTNGLSDIFVRDRTAGVTYLVSKNSAGDQGNTYSVYPSVSADGRYVAFMSGATNLVYADTNGVADIFVRDRQTGTTTRVSRNSAGVEGNDGSFSPSISGDGRYVAFPSDATNLVAGDTNGVSDIFVRDRNTGTTYLVSKSSAGVVGDSYSSYPSLSSDGRYVVFESAATNLVAGDTNGMYDVFVRDRTTGTTTLVSKSSTGEIGNGYSTAPFISADGRYVVFDSYATNLVAGDTNGMSDVFVRDRQTGTTTLVSKSSTGVLGSGNSYYASISADGRYVAFYSYAVNLVTGDTNGVEDIFVRDRQTGTTTRVSKSSAGVEGDGDSIYPSISADGRYVVFYSAASNLVPGDINGAGDTFVRDRQTGTTTLVSKS
jgi:Tol biopolymer transport system component